MCQLGSAEKFISFRPPKIIDHPQSYTNPFLIKEQCYPLSFGIGNFRGRILFLLCDHQR